MASNTTPSVPITKNLASFAANITFDSIPTELISHLKILLLDYIGIASYSSIGAESSQHFLAAIKALQGPFNGESTVINEGSTFLPQYAMILNGAYAHTLDFDDTHMGGMIHPGASVFSAALVEAESLGLSGKELLTAVAAGYEVLCRLGIALGTGGPNRGFHNSSTCGLFGCIAAIGRLRGLDEKQIESAFGIGISKAAGSMTFLKNGSWNKRLHPGFAAHDAYLSVAFAQAGVFATESPIEGDRGFLDVFSTSANRKFLEDSCVTLGKEWVLEKTAVKPFPACRYTHGAIELTASLRESSNHRTPSRIHLQLSTPYFHRIVGAPEPKKLHPSNDVDAQFSAYYQVAITWLDGSETGWGVYSRLHDEDVSKLLDKIEVSVDEEGLKDLQCRVTVTYEDGSEETKFSEAPLGEDLNPLPVEKVVSKYLSLATPVYGKEKAEVIRKMVMNVEDVKVGELLSSLASS